MAVRIDYCDRHSHHPESVRDYALDKVGKLERFFEGVTHVEVVLDQEHDTHIVELIVTASRHLRLVGRAEHEQVVVALDRALDKVERQLTKAKEQLKDHHRRELVR